MFQGSIQQQSDDELIEALTDAAANNSLNQVRQLLDQKKVNVDAVDETGRTALMRASAKGHLHMVQLLVETASANVEAVDKSGCTALTYASRESALAVVQYLVGTARSSVEAVDDYGETALMIGSRIGELAIVQCLFERGYANVEAVNNNGWNALIYASALGHLAIVVYLVKTGKANVEVVDEGGWTALMYASREGELAIVQFLVETARANVEALDKYGWTALMRTSECGELEIVQYLAETGNADVEVVNDDGETALMRASKKDNLQIVQFLVESAGASVASVDKHGRNALCIAKDKGHHCVAAYLEQQQLPFLEVAALPLPLAPDDSSKQSAPTLTALAPLTPDQKKMKQAVDGTGTTFAAREPYVQSILTDTVLGRGFFGTVFRGFDRELECSFAVKAINAEILAGGTMDEIQRTKKSFEKEQQTLSQFRHPNMAKLYAYSFPTDVRGNYYLVYEIAEKGSLDSFWRKELKRLRLSFRRRVQIALDIMTAVRFLHVGNADRSIASCFHRDIKSANIVLKQDLTAQLIDCGLAKFVVDATAALAASSGLPKGTPGYICPEYASGQVKVYDCACDIYSFGVVLVELWIGNVQNYEHSSTSCFNFTDQYIKLKKGKTKRDLLMDADPSFGLAPDDSFPDYMVRFVELAKECMDDHEDIPDGKHVMAELLAIRQACEADEDGTALQETPSPATELQFCERCQSFPKMPNDEICRMCSGEEHRRLEMETLRSLLLDMGSVLGNLDARFTNMVPRLFYIVPAEKKNAFSHPREYLKSKASTKYYLYFVCAHSKGLVDAPIKIRLSREWVTAAAPVLAVSLKLVQLGLSATGLPLNLDGFVYQVTTAGVDQMLSEVASIMANVGSHGDLLRRLEEQLPLSATDVPELEGEAYKLVVEKATEQSAWRNLMEPVRGANSSPPYGSLKT